MLMFRSCGVRELFVVSNSFYFRSHLLYSTIPTSDGATGNRKSHLLVDYLIDSLGFSRKEAVSAISKTKVTNLKSTSNADSVVNLFKDYGLNETQIRDVFFTAPNILKSNPNKTLEPKIRFFHGLGFSGSDLVTLIKKNPYIFRMGLYTRIAPIVDRLRKFMGSDERVIKVINGSKWIFSRRDPLRYLSENVMLLQDCGFSNDKALRFVLNYPHLANANPEWLRGRLHYIEGKLGISCGSPTFIYAAKIAMFSKSNIDKKMQVFRSYGWSDSELSTLLGSAPFSLTKSEATIQEKLNFFMKELGYEPSYLATCTSLFSVSLEKRVKPRYQVLKILKEKELVSSKPSLVTVLQYSESKFMEFIQRFKNEIRDAYMLKIFENNQTRLPYWCKNGDNRLPFCQVLGEYGMELPLYNTLEPYANMNENVLLFLQLTRGFLKKNLALLISVHLLMHLFPVPI